MAWSTRQLADLTGSTVKAIRHYHDLGLLDMPERAANGYKQYKVSHLIRLVQIKRLRDLGVPLSQVAAMMRADEEPDEAIRVLDAELKATIERLQRVRAELAVLLRHRAPMHVPPEFAPLSRELSDRHQALLTVYGTVFSERGMEQFRRLMAVQDEVDDEFDALPPDADDATIVRLAERMAPAVRKLRQEHPWSKDPMADSPLGAEQAGTRWRTRWWSPTTRHSYGPCSTSTTSSRGRRTRRTRRAVQRGPWRRPRPDDIKHSSRMSMNFRQ